MMRWLDKLTGGWDVCVVWLSRSWRFFASDTKADGLWWRLQVSYINGVQDLADQYADNIQVVEQGNGYSSVQVDKVVIPVGLSLFPYYQWDNGLMLGAGIGPFMYLWANGTDTYTHWQLPLSVTLGYTLFPNQAISPTSAPVPPITWPVALLRQQ